MRKLNLENWKELQPYITKADYNEYNSNCMTMLMWSSMYEVYFETYDTYAIAYTSMKDHHSIWLMPFCYKEYRKEAIAKIQEVSQAEQLPFEIHSITLEFKQWLQATYPNQFLLWECLNVRDYIYDRKQQESLTGKKMQKRRNHFNAFHKLYDQRYVYKKIEEQDIPHIYEFLAYWQATKDSLDSIDAEDEGIRLLLSNMDTLPIEGGCIYIDGKLEAFNIASYLSTNTVEIHVEKANRNIRGLYIAMLKFYLETLNEEVFLINREDDMGIPKLRKAKSDMHPIQKTRKFGSAYQKVHVQKAEDIHLPQIKQLWKTKFTDETEMSTSYYFNKLYHRENCYILVSDDEVIAMLQTRKMDILVNAQSERVSFIVGVATHEDYERCGYMKQLLNATLEDLKKDEKYTLLQAYNWDLYKPFGFEEVYKIAITTLDKHAYTSPLGVIKPCLDISSLHSFYKRYTMELNGYRLRDEAYYEEFAIPYHALWGRIYHVYEIDNKVEGTLLLEESEDAIHVLEVYACNQDAFLTMLSTLCQSSKNIVIHSDLQKEFVGKRIEQTNMMVKVLQDTPFPWDSLYIAEEL